MGRVGTPTRRTRRGSRRAWGRRHVHRAPHRALPYTSRWRILCLPRQLLPHRLLLLLLPLVPLVPLLLPPLLSLLLPPLVPPPMLLVLPLLCCPCPSLILGCGGGRLARVALLDLAEARLVVAAAWAHSVSASLFLATGLDVVAMA